MTLWNGCSSRNMLRRYHRRARPWMSKCGSISRSLGTACGSFPSSRAKTTAGRVRNVHQRCTHNLSSVVTGVPLVLATILSISRCALRPCCWHTYRVPARSLS
ncbi:hypothetical protein DFH06DRAFT_1342611 [Mycena polygramma]|nr:hypothetical protein DFH06DRAFT_1342611 [Mycena polygramma]